MIDQDISETLMDALKGAGINPILSVNKSAHDCSDFENEPYYDEFDHSSVGPIKYENNELNIDNDSNTSDTAEDDISYQTIKVCNYPLCIYQSKIERDFQNHSLTHVKNNNLPVECDLCFDRFQTISCCNDHMRRKHIVSISRKYLCEVCGKFVASYSKSHDCKLNKNNNCNNEMSAMIPVSPEHLKTKAKSNFKRKNVMFHSCDNCDYQSKRLYDVQRHQSVHGDKTDVFSCSDCTYQCSNKKIMKIHQNKHLNENVDCNDNLKKKFQCQICLINFESNNSLSHHLKSKHPSSCTVCKNCNFLISNVTNHQCSQKKKTVSNKICDTCGECTTDLLKHNYHVHNVSPFSCDICPKKFSSKSKLKQHKINHSKLPSKFVCNICEQVFKKSCNLKNHSLIHSEDVDAIMKSCHLCSYKTLIDSNLKRHLKIHKSKIIKCTMCGKCVTNETSLRLHYKRLHS